MILALGPAVAVTAAAHVGKRVGSSGVEGDVLEKNGVLGDTGEQKRQDPE